jgi:asparagine synthase (glutamine-hydrolysing)
MCGINGIFSYHPAAPAALRSELIQTRDHMSARGPDGAGEWWDKSARVGLGHRRLSIIDLSDRASQPMASAGGDVVVTFNGEIYNHPELRRELESEGVVFRSTSDTETLLHLYIRDGRSMVSRLRGMFAFAIWDRRLDGLFLARDPYGIKPLYTANDGWTFRFASQVKALLAGGHVSRDPEPAGVVGFHLWGSVPEPFTLYQEIRALPAGHTQWIDAAGAHEPQAYVSIAGIFAEGATQSFDRHDTALRVREAVRNSVAAHLLADVEVGVFLSAGVDSGALLGLMKDAGQQRVRAITLAFEEYRGLPEDESLLAAEVAREYGADHVIRFVSEQEFRADLPALLSAMDQPSIDGVNTWFVAKAAREAGLKVALSGLGGDELLAGYPSFRDVPRWASRTWMPARVLGVGFLSRQLTEAFGLLSDKPKARGFLEHAGTYEGAYLLRRGLLLPFELSSVLDAETIDAGLARLGLMDRIRDAALTPRPTAALSRVASLESCWYMRHQLLRDCDWAGMAHSLEIRTPLVDIELLKQLAPITPLLRAGEGKRALAAAPSRPLPEVVSQRAKTGFTVPTGRWIARQANATKGAASRAWARQVIEAATEPSSSSIQAGAA